MSLKSIFIGSIHLLAALCTILTITIIYIAFDSSGSKTFAIYPIIFTGALWLIVFHYLIGGKRKIQKVVNSVFGNNASVISHTSPYSLRYIGIDTNTGNILLVALDKSGQKVFGFDFNDWAGYEQKDCALTLKFNNLDTPSFYVNSNSKIIPFIHKLDFLLSSAYSPSRSNDKRFSQIVAERMQAA
ncbi:hypothetical protein FPE53_22720 [Salmonella enterica subsp. enterica]|uniref:Uncharacterized protein n=1 Tax=Salmonella enterica subsp. enterica serovar Aqua TaxID=1302615 RepID=A0A5X6EQ70_SALET|nr:hypothetical protein [Salmonella enterica subsp. enterica serovar Aqua]ECH1172016.1 hypothetical protein [Salmonella enterica subsp. enterica serovar Aqua]HCM8927676.1 hypothetical protein [Salmonella enterica subsp. enterica serovar Paratyphi B]